MACDADCEPNRLDPARRSRTRTLERHLRSLARSRASNRSGPSTASTASCGAATELRSSCPNSVRRRSGVALVPGAACDEEISLLSDHGSPQQRSARSRCQRVDRLATRQFEVHLRHRPLGYGQPDSVRDANHHDPLLRAVRHSGGFSARDPIHRHTSKAGAIRSTSCHSTSSCQRWPFANYMDATSKCSDMSQSRRAPNRKAIT